MLKPDPIRLNVFNFFTPQIQEIQNPSKSRYQSHSNTNHHKPAPQAHCTLPAFHFFKDETSLPNGSSKFTTKCQKEKTQFFGFVEVKNVRLRVTTRWVKNVQHALQGVFCAAVSVIL